MVKVTATVSLFILTLPVFCLLAIGSAWWLLGVPAAYSTGLLIDGWREMKRQEAAHEPS